MLKAFMQAIGDGLRILGETIEVFLGFFWFVLLIMLIISAVVR